MRRWIATFSALALGAASMAFAAPPASKGQPKPTIILVHGAFAGSSSWTGVIKELAKKGYPIIAAANPLRSVKTDAAYVSSIARNVPGPVVLVGHSYGGEVISVAAVGSSNVRALVFVAGLAPDIGESAASLGAKFPTGTLGQSLAPPVDLGDGSKDLYIEQSRYWHQFAADVPQPASVEMAITQRPITQAALAEPVNSRSWDEVPSWFIWGTLDRNIPATLHRFMAQRAQAREQQEIYGASHVVMISHPREVADIIDRAAQAR